MISVYIFVQQNLFCKYHNIFIVDIIIYINNNIGVMVLNLLNMRYFIEAAETLNFTKAANNLNISQQALSTHIAALERELDAELFIRSVPVTLTQGGLLFKKYAQRFLDEYSSMIHEMNDIKDERRGALSLGIAHTRGRILLPRILPHFQRAFPKVDIKITEGRNDEMQKSLSEGKLELLICKLPVIGANVRSEFFYEEKAVLMVSDALLEKYFGAEKDAVAKEIERTADIGPLEKLPFMLPHRGDLMRAVADELIGRAGFIPDIIVESENIETLLEMAVRGIGVTFYPKMFIDYSGFINFPDAFHIIPLNTPAAAYAMGF